MKNLKDLKNQSQCAFSFGGGGAQSLASRALRACDVVKFYLSSTFGEGVVLRDINRHPEFISGSYMFTRATNLGKTLSRIAKIRSRSLSNSALSQGERKFVNSLSWERGRGEGNSFAQQTETDLPSYCPNVLSTFQNLAIADRTTLVRNDEICHPELVSGSPTSRKRSFASLKMTIVSHSEQQSHKLDCFARPADGGNGARNDEKRPNLSALVPFKKVAFTLAEVLITLGVIGVVAAITMPTLLTNVNERINSNRQANIAYKITQATDKMKAMGLLGTYASTDDFVDELQKHLKVAKRCSASNIADCWPTEKVTTADGEEFDVKNARTGKNLNLKNNTSSNVGLVLADGASIILTYNQDSSGMDVGDVITASNKSLPVGFGKSQDFAYTTNTTGAIDFVMDVNGKKGPNSETRDNKYHDIRSFKAASFSKGCAGVDIPGIGCVVNLGTSYDCVTGDDKAKWDKDGYYDPSCWGGAKKACDDIGMTLPDIGTIQSINNKKDDYPPLPQSGIIWSSSDINRLIASSCLVYDGDDVPNAKNYHLPYAVCVGN